MSWLGSIGIKRYISAAISAILPFVDAVPGAAGASILLEQIAGAFGITGVTNAAISGTATKNKLAGIASVIATIILIAQFVPAAAPYIPILQKLAALIGAASLGALSTPQVEIDVTQNKTTE